MTKHDPYEHHFPIAIPTIIAGTLINAFTAAVVKYASHKGLTTGLIFFGRNFFAFLIFLLWMLFSGNIRQDIKSKRHRLLLFRGVLTTASIFLFYLSLRTISLGDATLLYLTIPLYMPFVAYFWKGFTIHKSIWWGISLGVIGVIFVLKPGATIFKLGSIWGLLAGLTGALGQFPIRLLHATETTKKIGFYYFLYGSFFGGLLSLIQPIQNYAQFEPLYLLYLVILGILGVGYLICLSVALKYAPAPFVSSFLFVSVIFAMIIDWLFWNVLPSLHSYVGFGLILIGVIIISVGHPRKKMGAST